MVYLHRQDVASDLRLETALTLEQMGITVQRSQHKAASSQHEIDLLYTSALTSVMLAAGLESIDRKDELHDPIEENVFEMSSEQREQRGIGSLPTNLFEAISLTEKSDKVRKALGDHVFDRFIKNKKIEWNQYRIQVTEYELKRYLPIL